MNNNLLFSWEFFLCLTVVTVFFFFLYFLEKKIVSRSKPSIEEYLAKMARIFECSVYEIFKCAAENWAVSRQKIETDFKNYLFSAHIPYYVQDLVRKNITRLDKSKDLPLILLC